MTVSLLTLPYELREQILTTLLSHKSNIRLQPPIENRAVFTSPITQVCNPLREEAIRVFYQVNTFTWTIDHEAAELPDPLQTPRQLRTTPLPSPLPHLNPPLLQSVRRLRLDLILPGPYSRKTWEGILATQLASFVAALGKGRRLKDLKLLVSSWHTFRGLHDWQVAVLLEGLGQLEVRGDVQVRGRGFVSELASTMREVGLGERMRQGGGGGRVCGRDVPEASCGGAGEDLDWEWEGGVVM